MVNSASRARRRVPFVTVALSVIVWGPNAAAGRELPEQPRNLEAWNAPAFTFKTGGACRSPIRTPQDCERAARMLGITGPPPQADGQGGVEHDPPFCYVEYDDSRSPGVLKFNPGGTNRGRCGKYDRCLCSCRMASLGQWHLAVPQESCATSCKRNGKRCTASATHAHNHEVDTASRMSEVVKFLGHECKAFNTDFGSSADVPVLDLKKGICYYSKAHRDESSVHCDAVPADNGNHDKSRVCWCEENADDVDQCSGGAVAHALPQGQGVAGLPSRPHPPPPAQPQPVAQPAAHVAAQHPPQPRESPHPPSPAPNVQAARMAVNGGQMPCGPVPAKAAANAAWNATTMRKSAADVFTIAANAAMAAGCGSEDAAKQASIAVRVAAEARRHQDEQHHKHTESEVVTQSMVWAIPAPIWAGILAALALCCCLLTSVALFFGKRLRFRVRQTVQKPNADEEVPLVKDKDDPEYRQGSHSTRYNKSSKHASSDYTQEAGGGRGDSSSGNRYSATSPRIKDRAIGGLSDSDTGYNREQMRNLRIPIGTRVLCHMRGEWHPGKVTRHWYRDENWPNGEFMPYVVLLDNGQHACAPKDDNTCIRREQDVDLLSAPSGGQKENRHYSGGGASSSGSPVRQARNPVSPGRNAANTARQGDNSPRRGDASPRRGGTSPRQGGTPPRQGGNSPRQGANSPRQGGRAENDKTRWPNPPR